MRPIFISKTILMNGWCLKWQALILFVINCLLRLRSVLGSFMFRKKEELLRCSDIRASVWRVLTNCVNAATQLALRHRTARRVHSRTAAGGRGHEACRASSSRVHACRRSVAASLNRSALCNVGVNEESAVQQLLASVANVRITLSSVPSGIPGPEGRRLRPRRAD